MRGKGQALRETRNVCVVTSGELSTTPRMLKAARTLVAAGYKVRVVSALATPWAMRCDAVLRRSERWEWTTIPYGRSEAPVRYLTTGLRFRFCRWASRRAGRKPPFALVCRAASRLHDELCRAISSGPCDLVYGGTSGALGAVALSARKAGIPYALDLEDFHGGESEESPLHNRLMELVERRVLPGAAFLTTSSEEIARAYREKYGIGPLVVHNVFPLPPTAPPLEPSRGESLELYWFSQTVGPGRGLEDAVRAMGKAGVPGRLHLRGEPQPGYLEALHSLAREVAPSLEVVHHPPVHPDDLIEASRRFDVGLALELPNCRNHELCQSNKLFAYLAAGLAVAVSETRGQARIAAQLGTAAWRYGPGDVETLSRGFAIWARDKERLAAAKVRAWKAAVERWHWEHPAESGVLLEAVGRVVPPRAGSYLLSRVAGAEGLCA